jgi:hypothetical protein
MMRFAVLFLIPALLTPAGAGAETPELPEPFHSIVELANAAPPEFAADALLRIVESNKLADKDARRELVDKAFQLAGAAKFPVRMMAVPAGNTDTRSASLNQAYTLKLDLLSLESRAVRDMLPLDRPKARELFGQMPKPSLVPLTCDDALAYEPLEFYEALSAMVNGGFTPEEKAKDEHFKLLLDALGQVMSPSQLPPLSQAIESSSVTPAQRQNLWARFNGLLADMQPDDRSFSASLPALFSVSAPGIEPALEKYQQKNHGCETDSGSEPSSRVPAERFQDTSAADSAAPDTSSPDPSSPASSPGSQQRPSKPTTPKLELFWQSANAKQLLEAGKKLRFSSSSEPLSDADRATVGWQQQLSDYLNLIAGWTSDQEGSDAVYYHEKCLVYTSLLDLVAPGPQGDKILADYVDFISKSSLYQQSPAEWYVEPHTLLERSHTNVAQHPKVLEAYQNSGNPVLELAVALEKTLNGGSPAWAVSAK